MKSPQIKSIINSHYPDEVIELLEIQIHPENNQVDTITIYFTPYNQPDLTKIGFLINDMDNLTNSDDYGDMTEMDFKFSTFGELPDSDEQYITFIFTFNIDS